MQYRYTFKARVEFSLILNAAMLQASTNESDNQVVQSGTGRIIETIENLEAWYRALPDPLLPSNIVFPSQLKLQYLVHLEREWGRGQLIHPRSTGNKLD